MPWHQCEVCAGEGSVWPNRRPVWLLQGWGPPRTAAERPKGHGLARAGRGQESERLCGRGECLQGRGAHWARGRAQESCPVAGGQRRSSHPEGRRRSEEGRQTRGLRVSEFCAEGRGGSERCPWGEGVWSGDLNPRLCEWSCESQLRGLPPLPRASARPHGSWRAGSAPSLRARRLPNPPGHLPRAVSRRAPVLESQRCCGVTVGAGRCRP